MSFSRRFMLATLFYGLLLQFTLAQQVNRFFVYFSDKDNSSYSIDNPEAFLSSKAIERRNNQNIAITTEDLPVVQDYLSQVAATGAEVYHSSRWMNGAIIQTDSSTLESIQQLSFVTSIVYIAKGTRLSNNKVSYTIPTEFIPVQSNSISNRFQNAVLNVDDMHEDGYRGEGMTIAVLDGGFAGADLFEPMQDVFEENRYLGGEDLVKNSGNPFQYDGHGTAVLSTIAAFSDSLIGTAYKANFLLYVTEDVATEYRIEEYNWLIACEKADSAGADIIQSSVGYSYFFTDRAMDHTYEEMDGRTTVITQAANLAHAKGMVVVTSAGNEGNGSWKYVTAPADGTNVIAVGSINREYERSSFSSFGPTKDGRVKPDVMAVGSGTVLLTRDGFISSGSGTSFAAPQISGLVAGIWQANPNWSNNQVIRSLKLTASRALNPDNSFGYGVPNYKQAVEGSLLSVHDIVNNDITVFPNPFRDEKLIIDLTNQPRNEKFLIMIYDTRGSLVLNEKIKAKDKVVELKVPAKESGVYIMKIVADNFSKQVKLIKE